MGSINLPPLERRGSQQPTWLALPSGGFDNGSGDDAIELAALAGLDLDEWQQDALRAACLVRESAPSKWAATTVDLSVGRQNGKGSLFEARQLAGLMLFGSKFAIHTAHELKTTAEHFLRMQQLIEGCPDIERHVMRIRTGKGDEAIEMRSGRRLRFISRSGGSGRGFAGVDDVYLDESMFLTQQMMQAIVSTQAARSRGGNPQLWRAGSAPYAGKPEQAYAHALFAMLRGDRRPKDSLYIDFGTTPPSADELRDAGSVERWVDLIVEDVDRWYASNPALGVRISEDFCRQELATLGPLGFAVERLGLVIPPEVAENRSGIDLERWGAAAENPDFELAPGCVVAVAVDEHGARGSLVAAGMVDGVTCFELVEQGGVGQLVAWLQRQAPGTIGHLVLNGSSHAPMVSTLLGASPFDVVRRTQAQAADAEAALVLSVADGTVRHRGDERMRSAVLAAEQVRVGDRWSWSLRQSQGDVTALKAAALATAEVSSGVAVHDPNEVFVH